MVANNQSLVKKKRFFIIIMSKTFDFFGRKSQKKFHIFLCAFIWKDPNGTIFLQKVACNCAIYNIQRHCRTTDIATYRLNWLRGRFRENQR